MGDFGVLEDLGNFLAVLEVFRTFETFDVFDAFDAFDAVFLGDLSENLAFLEALDDFCADFDIFSP